MRKRTRRLVLALAVAAVALGALAPSRTAHAARPKKVKNEPYPAEFRAQVRTAIRKGIGYLRGQQMRYAGELGVSHRFEETAAVLWVLRRAGIELESPEDQFEFRILRARKPEDVAQASLLVLALCAEPLPDGDPFALEDPADEPKPPPLSDEDRALARQTVDQLLDAQVMTSLLPARARSLLPPEHLRLEPRGGWGMDLDPRMRGRHADVPTTYLALLALEAAARRGIEVPPERFLAALELLLRFQAPKGRLTTLRLNEVRGDTRLEWTVKAHARGFGWTGSLCDEPSGYETAAGAVGLVICKDALQGQRTFTPELRAQTEEALHDALAWIQKRYTIRENPDPHGRGDADTAGLYHHHWLQSLARLAIHLRLRFLDKHDWYREGAEALIQAQAEEGCWDAIWWSNCYGLLFLQRASLRSIAPVITPSER